MALFDGVPFIVKTPSEEIERAKRSATDAGRLFGQAMIAGIAAKQRQKEFEIEAEMKRKAASAELNMRSSALEIQRMAAQNAIGEAKVKAVEYPSFAQWMSNAGKVSDFNSLSQMAPPSFVYKPFQQSAENFLQERRLQLSQMEQAKQWKEHETNLNMYYAGRLKAINSIQDKRQQFLLSKELEGIMAQISAARASADFDALSQAQQKLSDYHEKLQGLSSESAPSPFEEEQEPTEGFESWLQKQMP